MSEFMSFFEAAASGGGVGLIGGIFNQIIGFFTRRQQHSQKLELAKLTHEQEMSRQDKEIQYMEAEASARIAEKELELQRDTLVANSADFQGSIDHDMHAIDHDGHWLLLFAEFIRKTYRPLLCTFLVYLVYAFYQTASESQMLDIQTAVLGLTATAVTWWFVDRSARVTK